MQIGEPNLINGPPNAIAIRVSVSRSLVCHNELNKNISKSKLIVCWEKVIKIAQQHFCLIENEILCLLCLRDVMNCKN